MERKMNVNELLNTSINVFDVMDLCRNLASCRFGYGFIARSTPKFRAPKTTSAEWFETFGSGIAHMHFTDGKPAGRLVWGEGLHPLDDWMAALERWGYTGSLGQLLTKEAYFFEPEKADRTNMAALAPYFA